MPPTARANAAHSAYGRTRRLRLFDASRRAAIAPFACRASHAAPLLTPGRYFHWC